LRRHRGLCDRDCPKCGRKNIVRWKSNGILSRLDVKWIRVHSDEYDKVLLAVKRLAERESQGDSSRQLFVAFLHSSSKGANSLLKRS
jgi:hypothetical protein